MISKEITEVWNALSSKLCDFQIPHGISCLTVDKSKELSVSAYNSSVGISSAHQILHLFQ